MPTKPINRRRPKDESTFDLQALASRVGAWLTLKRQMEKLKKQIEKDKTDFKTLVHKVGVPDEKGSLFLELAEPVLGVKALKNQRSAPVGWNEAAAERISKRAGIYEDVTRLERVWDPDRIYAAFYDKKITKAQLDQIFPVGEQFSFFLLDENGRPVT